MIVCLGLLLRALLEAGVVHRDDAQELKQVASRRAGSRTIHGCRKHLTLPLT